MYVCLCVHECWYCKFIWRKFNLEKMAKKAKVRKYQRLDRCWQA